MLELDDSFKIHLERICKMNSVLRHFYVHDYDHLPDSFEIPDDFIDSSSVSELVDYLKSKYYA